MMTCRTTWCRGALALVALMMCAAADVAAQNLECPNVVRVVPTSILAVTSRPTAPRQQLRDRVLRHSDVRCRRGQRDHLTAAGRGDIFVAKYDSNGALVWATRAGGTDIDRGRGIATDGAGNSYVTGQFSGHGDVRPRRGQRDHPHLPRRPATSSSPSTIRAARWSGPNAAGGTGPERLGHRDRRRRQQLRHRVLRWHGDVRRRRGQRDHAHRRAAPGHLRRQVRSERRAGLGQTLRVAPAAMNGPGHRDGRRRQQLRHRDLRGHGDVRRRRDQRDHAHRRWSNDIFVAKYDPSGALVWAKRAGGTSTM